jgi:hypothetical protein
MEKCHFYVVSYVPFCGRGVRGRVLFNLGAMRLTMGAEAEFETNDRLDHGFGVDRDQLRRT